MEKAKNNFVWPVVAVVCTCIIASGVYLGLRNHQPQPTIQSYAVSPSSDYATSDSRVSTGIDKSDPIVYVTQTGQCYHSGTCSYLRKSKIPMKLSEAKMRYRPCSKCGPPQ